MTDELRFDDLTFRERAVFIGAAKYTLREPTEATVTTYRDTAAKAMKIDADDGKTITGSITGANAVLVSLCLFDVDNQNVPVDVVRTWPARVVKDLFDAAYEWCGLSDDEDEASLLKQLAAIQKKLAAIGEDAAKNSPSDTTGGSE